LAAEYADWTPYQFAAGNPISFNDLSGARLTGPEIFRPSYVGGETEGGGRGGSGGGFGDRGYGGSPVNDWGSGYFGGGSNGIDLSGGGGSIIGSAIPGFRGAERGYYTQVNSSIYNPIRNSDGSINLGGVTAGVTFHSDQSDKSYGWNEIDLSEGLLEGFWDKNTAFYEMVEELPRGAKVFGTGLAGLGLLFAVESTRREIAKDGVTFVTGSKAVLGIGIAGIGAVAAVAVVVSSAPVWGTVATVASVAGFVYGVAEYSGGVDYMLNSTRDFGKALNNSYKSGINSLNAWH
jgi:hypothetical protein